MVIGPIDGALPIAANDMHPLRRNGGPRHFAAWDRQRGATDPTARRTSGSRAVNDALCLLVRCQMVRRATLEASIGVRGGSQFRQSRLRVGRLSPDSIEGEGANTCAKECPAIHDDLAAYR
jgi:hypothetical protein